MKPIPIEVPEGYEFIGIKRFKKNSKGWAEFKIKFNPLSEKHAYRLPYKIGDKICEVCGGSGRLKYPYVTDTCYVVYESEPCTSCKEVKDVEVVERECDCKSSFFVQCADKNLGGDFHKQGCKGKRYYFEVSV